MSSSFRSVTAGLCMLVGTACGASPASTDDLGSTEQAATRAIDGQYAVPTTPELAASATHPVNVKIQRYAGMIRVHYNMPVELVGTPNVSVDLEGPDTGDTLELTGKAGIGHCSMTESTFTCNERLTGIQVDVDGVGRAAVADGLTAAEVNDRLAVAHQFALDPIGILTTSNAAERGRRRRGR
jgi:hypothetical protein